MARFLLLHPEWWTLAVSSAAWIALLSGIPQFRHDHAAMLRGEIQWGTDIAHWFLMVLAMMLPFVIGPVRATAIRSLWARRHRGIVFFLSGYMLSWMAAGVLLILVTSRSHFEQSAARAVLSLAALWQFAPIRRRFLMACHRIQPLAPRGWRADRDCLRYGTVSGCRCLVTCGALMLGCALTGHNIWIMLLITAAGICERYWPRMPDAVAAGAIFACAAFLGSTNSLFAI